MYAENLAFIEDALGYKFPVPLHISPSWEGCFSKQNGHSISKCNIN